MATKPDPRGMHATLAKAAWIGGHPRRLDAVRAYNEAKAELDCPHNDDPLLFLDAFHAAQERFAAAQRAVGEVEKELAAEWDADIAE